MSSGCLLLNASIVPSQSLILLFRILQNSFNLSTYFLPLGNTITAYIPKAWLTWMNPFSWVFPYVSHQASVLYCSCLIFNPPCSNSHHSASTFCSHSNLNPKASFSIRKPDYLSRCYIFPRIKQYALWRNTGCEGLVSSSQRWNQGYEPYLASFHVAERRERKECKGVCNHVESC